MATTFYYIKNVSRYNVYVKELFLTLRPEEIIKVNDFYNFKEISDSEDLTNLIKTSQVVVGRDDKILNITEAIDFINTPNECGLTSDDIAKLNNINITGPIDLDQIQTDVTVNNAKISNVRHTGEVTGDTTLSLESASISNKLLTTALSGMEVLVNDTGVLKKVDASDFLGSTPIVADAAARDVAYPSPSDGFQVFNLYQNLVETYNATFDLWLHHGIVVGVEDTAIQAVSIRKIVFVSPTAATVGGQEYPIADFASASGERNVTIGVITRLGASISGTERYLSIAHYGKYYVDFSSAVTIGDSVYSTTNTTGLAISGTFSQTGTIGQAIENSGSNPSFPSSVLVSLQNKN